MNALAAGNGINGLGSARRRWSAWLLLALLAGWLVAHIGCHGDEDNELFLPVSGGPPWRAHR